MTSSKDSNLGSRLLACSRAAKSLLSQINEIELNENFSTNKKLEKIKIIREEISKVSVEVANIKREITLLNTYQIN